MSGQKVKTMEDWAKYFEKKASKQELSFDTKKKLCDKFGWDINEFI
ncbi:MAG: hypothetical protein LBL60_02210 [Mycoplasmataceae bacterium]|nr:hypothetical protein [Mycoplasmataceae bacterium]